jgi:hypothetical protein
MNRQYRLNLCLSAAICALLAALTAGCETTGGPIGIVQAALVPPPPVNQNLGFSDQPWNDTYPLPANCLKCHDGTGGTTCPDPTTNCQVVSLRHHMMLDPSSPRFKPYYCTDCHTPDPATGVMSVTFDCRVCHTVTPHHKSVPAKERHCAVCHGSLVNNFDDGHYIPTYAKSIVTPDPNCRVWTDASHTTCAAGGCRACHVASDAVTPPTWNNDSTHHGTGLGQSPNDPAQCGWCHSVGGNPPTPAIDIRTCESCHGPTSLHAIEYQYNTNNGTAGYGHIGADFDCWGCHGFFDKYELPPSFGPSIPTIDSIQPASVESGATGELVLKGQSFINSVTRPSGVETYSPTVVLARLDNAYNEVGSKVVLTLSAPATESEIRATLPSLPSGLYSFRVYKDYQGSMEKMSDMAVLTVKPACGITSACLAGSTLTVAGACFGPKPDDFPSYGLFVEGATCTVASWSDTQIVATCSKAKKNDTLTVSGIITSPLSAKIGKNCK